MWDVQSIRGHEKQGVLDTGGGGGGVQGGGGVVQISFGMGN